MTDTEIVEASLESAFETFACDPSSDWCEGCHWRDHTIEMPDEPGGYTCEGYRKVCQRVDRGLDNIDWEDKS